MKFRYIMIDNGDFYGTNNEEIAKECAISHYVMDVVEGKELDPVVEVLEIPEEYYRDPDTGKFWSEL